MHNGHKVPLGSPGEENWPQKEEEITNGPQFCRGICLVDNKGQRSRYAAWLGIIGSEQEPQKPVDKTTAKMLTFSSN